MKSARLTPDIDETAARVVLVREWSGLAKGEFADSLGVDRSSWTKIEKAEKPLHADYAYTIFRRYRVPMDYLYSGSMVDLPASLAENLRKR